MGVERKFSVFENFFIGAMKFLSRTYFLLSVFSSNPDPLLSMFISFYCMILLYLPHLFFSLLFSPVLISTAVILATLLRLGSSQQEKQEILLLAETQEPDSKHQDPFFLESVTDLGLTKQEKDAIFLSEIEGNEPEDEAAIWVNEKQGCSEMRFFRNADLSDVFVGWDRGGPLEVIYEEYEGEEEEDSQEKRPEMVRRHVGFDELVCSSFWCPGSDSSEGEFPAWDLPENLCFRWEETEGLIEIPLALKPTVGFEADEENLIEINLFDGGK